MSDPRLTRLASLWQQGIEGALQAAEEAELQGLLADADLAEAWMEQQGDREASPSAPAGRPPARLRAAFQRRFKPLLYWGLRAGVPALAGLVWLAWMRDKPAAFVEAGQDDRPFIEAAETPQAQPQRHIKKTDLGPPPGLNERHHLWITRSDGSMNVSVTLDHAARLQVHILDAQGRVTWVIDQGQQPRGKAHLQWDGRLKSGEKAPAGRYKAQILMDGVQTAEQDLVIEKN